MDKQLDPNSSNDTQAPLTTDGTSNEAPQSGQPKPAPSDAAAHVPDAAYMRSVAAAEKDWWSNR